MFSYALTLRMLIRQISRTSTGITTLRLFAATANRAVTGHLLRINKRGQNLPINARAFNTSLTLHERVVTSRT